MTLSLLIFLIFPLIVIAAGISDLVSFRIPNIFSAILAAVFIPFALVAGLSAGDIGVHFGLAALVLLVGFFLFSAGLLGAGDAKLLAASALWIGGSDLTLYLLIVSLAGGILALAILMWRRTPMPPWVLKIGWINQIYVPAQKGRDVPYAVAMAVALLWVLPGLEIMELAAV